MSYALITGASSGIGHCYAREMARRGYNIIAVSNQQEQLDQVATELHNEFNIEVISIYADLSKPNSAKDVFDYCNDKSLDVEVLICNAGMLLFSTLVHTDPERLNTIINLHCTTTTLLCRYFGQQMKERRRGRILLMSSSTAWLPYPTISHYAATKAYVKSFAFALWYELHRYGVSVTAVFPGAVDTPFYNLSSGKRKLFRMLGIMMSPERIARRGVKAMFSGQRRLTPGLFTKFTIAICAILPARVLDILIRIKPIRELLERI